MKEVKNYFDTVAHGYSEKKNKLGKWKEKQEIDIFNMLDIEAGQLILDAGSGDGYYSLKIQRLGGIVYSVDISTEMVKQARKIGINTVLGNLETIKYPYKFDKLLFLGSLEFCNNPETVLVNAVESLKEEGAIIINVPMLSVVGIIYLVFHLTHGIRIHLFTENSISKMFKTAGIEVINIKRTSALSTIFKGQRPIKPILMTNNNLQLFNE